MKKFIKSSSRTKADPTYYRKKVERWTEQRNKLLDEACVIEEATDTWRTTDKSPAEAEDMRRKADKLTSQIRWGTVQMGVAYRIVENIKNQGGNR